MSTSSLPAAERPLRLHALPAVLWLTVALALGTTVVVLLAWPFAPELRSTWWTHPPAQQPDGSLGDMTRIAVHNLSTLGWPFALRALGWRRWKLTRLVAIGAMSGTVVAHLIVVGTAIAAWPGVLGLLAHGPLELLALACVLAGWRSHRPGVYATVFVLCVLVGATVEVGLAP